MSGPKEYPCTLEELHEIAEAYDCKLVVAESDELLLDIDDPTISSEGEFIRRNDALLSLIGEKFSGELRSLTSWMSRNGGLHIRIKLGVPVPTPIAIALQAALGSDPKREILACWEYLEQTVPWEPGDPPQDTRSLFKPKA